MKNKLMNGRQEQRIHGIVTFAFHCVVSVWPASSREWALAMQAELPELENSQESLRWLGGGIMSLGKAWWNQAIYGWKDNEKEPSSVATPGPIALSLAAIALAAFFLWPAAHEGFSAVMESWSSDRNATAFHARVQEMTKKAEAEHDAKTIAFVSRYANYPDGQVRLIEEAVTMDPSLTWMYVRGGNYGISQEHGWLAKLEAWDPDNATPYLAEASNRWVKIQRSANWQAPKEQIVNDPAWRGLMEKAFAAPRFDYYSDRAIDLGRTVLSAQNIHDPLIVGYGVFSAYPAGLFEAQAYSKSLLDQANAARQKGDTAAAMRLAWTAAHFAERVRANAHSDLVRATAEGMLQPAYEFLQPLEASAGHAEVAKLLSIENEGFIRKKAEPHSPIPENPYRHFSALGIALHAGGLGIALFGGLLILSLAWLVMGRFSAGLRAGRIYRWACNCARFAPASLAASVGLMAFSFAPYREAVQFYFNGAKDPVVFEKLNTMMISLYSLPGQFKMPLSYDHQGIYFGEWFVMAGLVTVLLITAALVIYRLVSQRQAAKVRPA